MENNKMKGGNVMNKNFIFGTFALLVVAVLGVSFVSANGFGSGMGSLTDNQKDAIQERQVAMQNAIETNDYAAWEALMLERIAEMEDSINNETFSEIVQRHENMEKFRSAADELKNSGNFSFEKMESLREQYGVEDRGMGMHDRRGMRSESGNGMMMAQRGCKSTSNE